MMHHRIFRALFPASFRAIDASAGKCVERRTEGSEAKGNFSALSCQSRSDGDDFPVFVIPAGYSSVILVQSPRRPCARDQKWRILARPIPGHGTRFTLVVSRR